MRRDRTMLVHRTPWEDWRRPGGKEGLIDASRHATTQILNHLGIRPKILHEYYCSANNTAFSLLGLGSYRP